MKKLKSDRLSYSPTDLTRFFESEFGSWMEHYYELHGNKGPLTGVHKNPPDPLQGLLAEKGNLHEDNVMSGFADPESVVRIERVESEDTADRIRKTVAAMEAGADLIYQAALTGPAFFGYADLLRKVPGKSAFGDHHYEPIDMKIASTPKPTALLQLCAYADALESVQGRRPENMEVITGDGKTHVSRVERYFAFYQVLKQKFMSFHDAFEVENLPLPSKTDDHRDWSIYAKRVLHGRDDIQPTAPHSGQASGGEMDSPQ